MGFASSVVGTARFLFKHPLTRDEPLRAAGRYLRWQVQSRIWPSGAIVPFANGTHLALQQGMAGATGNIYVGLHDFDEMGFCLHALRPGDLFVDVGANVGAYTVLAGAAAGANVIAFEPVPKTFAYLRRNVLLNDIESRVTLHNVGVGDSIGTLRFSDGSDAMNHVLTDAEPGGIEVPIRRLDDLCANATPYLIKIDVEGFEAQVLRGAKETLARCEAVLLETNSSGLRYGHSDSLLHQLLTEAGLSPFRYAPSPRVLTAQEGPTANGNTLYLRHADRVQERVRQSPPFVVLGRSV